jgi:hypothetical protein
MASPSIAFPWILNITCALCSDKAELDMGQCENCKKEIDTRIAWLTGEAKFFCSEFCAEAEGFSRTSLAPPKLIKPVTAMLERADT